jgi:hypothetical protein
MRGQDQPSRADFGTFDAQWDVFPCSAVAVDGKDEFALIWSRRND